VRGALVVVAVRNVGRVRRRVPCRKTVRLLDELEKNKTKNKTIVKNKTNIATIPSMQKSRTARSETYQ
jgi:hypothetical protein